MDSLQSRTINEQIRNALKIYLSAQEQGETNCMIPFHLLDETVNALKGLGCKDAERFGKYPEGCSKLYW